MNIPEQINEYITSQPEPKHKDLLQLHQLMLQILPNGRLWFDNGINSEGKIVSNPNIGYGFYTINYADGKTKDFFQTGLSANTSGISVYIMGLKDKTYLPQTFGQKIGKATVTGYCIKFKKLADINIDVLEAAVQYGIEATNEG